MARQVHDQLCCQKEPAAARPAALKRMCTFPTCCPVTEGVCASQQHSPAAPCVLLVGIGDRCRVQAVVAAGLALVNVAVAAGPHIDAVPLGGIYAVVPAHSYDRQIASGCSPYMDSWVMLRETRGPWPCIRKRRAGTHVARPCLKEWGRHFCCSLVNLYSWLPFGMYSRGSDCGCTRARSEPEVMRYARVAMHVFGMCRWDASPWQPLCCRHKERTDWSRGDGPYQEEFGAQCPSHRLHDWLESVFCRSRVVLRPVQRQRRLPVEERRHHFQAPAATRGSRAATPAAPPTRKSVMFRYSSLFCLVNGRNPHP